MLGITAAAVNLKNSIRAVFESRRFARLVGKENVIAYTDCSLRHLPDASLAFAKLYALAEGARLATREPWRG
jgi:5-methyltetrahydropteroyltriglutamate--homocysteine methyltransferase